MKNLVLFITILLQNHLFAEIGDSLLPKRMLGFNITTALIPRIEKSAYWKDLREPINLSYGLNLAFSRLIIKRKHVYFDTNIGYQFGNQKFSNTSTNYLTKQDYRDYNNIRFRYYNLQFGLTHLIKLKKQTWLSISYYQSILVYFSSNGYTKPQFKTTNLRSYSAYPTGLQLALIKKYNFFNIKAGTGCNFYYDYGFLVPTAVYMPYISLGLSFSKFQK